MRRDADPKGMPARDMELYEQLISDGIAAAARRRSAIDHVTARRTAIWLMSRPQQPDFIRGLLQFAKTGAITQNLKTQLRRNVPTAMLWGRVCEYFYISPEELSEMLARLGARRY